MTRFSDVDSANPDNLDDGVPHEWFTALRRHDPLYWQDEPHGSGSWKVTKYSDLVMVSRPPELFSSWRGDNKVFDLIPEELERSRILTLTMDTPQHAKYRRLVSRGFTPKRIVALAIRVKALARPIVDDIEDGGHCDFVEDVAARLPTETIFEMIGVRRRTDATDTIRATS